jgi:3-deoxy-manno-octulosonate cytidylyltransferase (CMP-KDO synthetase)
MLRFAQHDIRQYSVTPLPAPTLAKSRTIAPGDCVGIIPARWASTRFPGKILTPVAGQPLLARIIHSCRQSRRVKHWIVATDDRRIALCAETCGVEAVMTPKTLKSGSDRAAYVSRNLRARWIVNWQGDEWSPNGRPIDLLIIALEENSDCPVATLARQFPRDDAQNPNRVKVVLSQSRRALYFSRAPIPHAGTGTEPFWLHLGAYAFERPLLLQFARWPATALEKRERLEQLRFLDHDVPIAVGLCRVKTHGVDTPDDARKLERLIKARRSK